ncbi:MAG TPA: PAS domain-containing protein, partial [Cytophagaceae bacterium]
MMDFTNKTQESKVDMSSFMEAIFDNARVACILLLDREGNILNMNNGFTETFGYTKDDLLGRHFSKLYTVEDLEGNRPQRELEQALSTGFAEDNNYLIHKNGHPLWCHGESIIVKNQ